MCDELLTERKGVCWLRCLCLSKCEVDSDGLNAVRCMHLRVDVQLCATKTA